MALKEFNLSLADRLLLVDLLDAIVSEQADRPTARAIRSIEDAFQLRDAEHRHKKLKTAIQKKVDAVKAKIAESKNISIENVSQEDIDAELDNSVLTWELLDSEEKRLSLDDSVSSWLLEQLEKRDIGERTVPSQGGEMRTIRMPMNRSKLIAFANLMDTLAEGELVTERKEKEK